MITEKDWQEIIAKCQGVSKPNEVAHILLAAATYMTDRKQAENRQQVLGYSGDSEFSHLVSDKNPELVMSVFEELVDTISVLSPKLYTAVMNKLRML